MNGACVYRKLGIDSVMIRLIVTVAVFGCLMRDRAAADFKTFRGRHITLQSDTGTTESLTDLVESFDASVSQWERMLDLPDGKLDSWHVRAFVMEQPDRFRASGDLPQSLDFQYGYAMPGVIWVRLQPSQYYTRHLLLHEGVHALAIDQFGGTGPSWFSEGVAELLSVHRGQGDEIQIGTIPADKNEVPYWGRFKLLSQARDEAKIPNLSSLLRLPNRLDGDVESYGWCWLAGSLLTQYPEYRPIWLKTARDGLDVSESFTESFRKSVASQWPIIQARWRILTETADYGFDWSRERVDLSIKDPLFRDSELRLNVAADKGWQSTGVRFAPGTKLSIQASGRCSVNQIPKPWISEPAGVTIHYANGRPLGQLLVCVLPNLTGDEPFLDPLKIVAVDPETDLKIDQHCWLLFRINDQLGDLGNNNDGYSVILRAAR
ncbi:hypothetical protein [Roseiconus lacunae]|uniref:DUF1570 domain-containing protein n=1 Tax=Roseiconus lacunae TaxID=2605694 RepID=A0ABT7PMW5_9BACT|nr:hypothetical protein [Roseiconus lacunae]MDM4017823.1 hypothetical protein [Roseiconus lacunae]